MRASCTFLFVAPIILILCRRFAGTRLPISNEPEKSMAHRVAEIFRAALKLGLTSFGGPIAHIGYFERTYVEQLRWLTREQFGGLLALCQMLPGPTSSQVGFAIGWHRGGWRGALAAWLGFTPPSAVFMFVCALLAEDLNGTIAAACLRGLQIVAVAVVAQAVWNMARTLCPD